jgi:uncharacterized RmlC-like cupin family protein
MSEVTESSIEVVRKSGLQPAAETEGMERRMAFETGEATVIFLQVEGGSVSGWHHHSGNHVFGYLLEGEGKWEYGEDGAETVMVEAGDFWHIPPRTIHRDINPGEQTQQAVVAMVGSGPLAVDVDGPDAEV